MKTTLLLAALFILVLGGGYLWKSSGSLSASSTYDTITATSSVTESPAATTATTTNGTSVGTVKTTAPNSYTQAQVAIHNTSGNCWATINGNVYNLTSWISQHPGGEAPILGLCGKDGTSAFENQHSDNARANAELATLKIGTLTH